MNEELSARQVAVPPPDAEGRERRDDLVARIDGLVRDVVAPASDDVDRHARFPAEAIEALRTEGLLGAAVPAPLGGAGLDLKTLSDFAQRLARGCGATSMVWVMHQVQVACVASAAEGGTGMARHLVALVDAGALVASVTSEVGVGGDLRHSIAAVVENGDGSMTLEKRSPTVSYGEAADAYLVTARRTPESQPDDQVAVIVRRDQVELEPSSDWDAMGMRGTVSPGFRLTAKFDRDQILPVPFGELATTTMVPWSHILWASCWYGLSVRRSQRRGERQGERSPAGPRRTPRSCRR